MGYQGRNDGASHTEAQGGELLPESLEPRRRSERALLAVIQQAYVEGVSTRRVDDLVKALGCEGISKSQVSRICGELDRSGASFLDRPLAGGPYCYLWLDALSQKVREEGRIVNVSVAVATAVNAEGRERSLVWTWARVRTARSGLRSCVRCPRGTERCGVGDLGCTPWT